MQEQTQWSTFFAGFLLGAGVAFLMAPQTGAQLRRSLREYAADAKDELEGIADKGMAAWDTVVEQGQEYVERGADTVRAAAENARKYAQQAPERVREAVRERS